MKCPKCESILPNDSEYCQYCGINISEALSQKQVASRSRSRRSRMMLIIILAVFATVLAGLDVFQYVHNLDLSEKVLMLEQQTTDSSSRIVELEQQIESYMLANADLEKQAEEHREQIANKDNTISEQESTISRQEDDISNLEYEVDNFNEIFRILSLGNLGYASYNFKSSESFIVINEDDYSRKFTLTAHWNNGGNVSVSYVPTTLFPAAKVSFDNETWTTSTTMSIIPEHQGVTVVRFSNDVDSSSFNIVIVVD